MKVALVTGSVSGIGLASARALARDGYRVMLHSLADSADIPDEAREFLASSDHVGYLSGDVSDPSVPSVLVSETVETWGRVDCVVSNAAVSHYKNWLETTSEEWDRVYATNARATLLLAQAAAPHLEATGGNIVVVSSTNALRVNRNNLAYDTSKAALNHLAKGLALEFLGSKVRVNVVMPGGTRSPMLDNWMVDYSGSTLEAKRLLDDAEKAGVLAEPQDIADVVAFLASPQARWVTGATIVADGGVHLTG